MNVITKLIYTHNKMIFTQYSSLKCSHDHYLRAWSWLGPVVLHLLEQSPAVLEPHSHALLGESEPGREVRPAAGRDVAAVVELLLQSVQLGRGEAGPVAALARLPGAREERVFGEGAGAREGGSPGRGTFFRRSEGVQEQGVWGAEEGGEVGGEEVSRRGAGGGGRGDEGRRGGVGTQSEL